MQQLLARHSTNSLSVLTQEQTKTLLKEPNDDS
jgi:hypothetical protein